ncbi:MAG: lysine--tRNA ligase [Candidatus Zambryskibacteria bacterium]|nr:lysine--tRNA ligase [Candidatus Zambryskibacteria bacterium]
MASIDEIRSARLEKLKILKEKGIDPYPITTNRNISAKEAANTFADLENKKEDRVLAGRMMSLRAQGKIIFFDINDGTGSFQVLLKSGDPLPQDQFELFEQCFDIGDFVEIKGTFFLTKQQEKTLLAEEIKMLSKSLRPLPEKWHGLSDIEERFRKRYLDLLSNPEVKERFLARTKIVSAIRKILDEAGYIEVETPALQPLYGGASAEPFTTHHNALDIDLYLRISDELYLKRLLTAGFPKVYEIARDFRNEGIDTTHNPEFTMLEFYEAYSDGTKQRAFVEDMMRRIALLISSSGVITFDEERIDFNKPFKVMKHPGVSDEEFKKTVKPALIQPTFLIDYPIDMLPLTKRKEDNPKLVDAFQLYAGGLELVKAFSELNDPIDQRARFEAQEKSRKKGEKETQPLDEDFLEAMEYGIPPAGGVGIGIDRLVMLLTNVKNIKEVILFPTLKPKQ